MGTDYRIRLQVALQIAVIENIERWYNQLDFMQFLEAKRKNENKKQKWFN